MTSPSPPSPPIAFIPLPLTSSKSISSIAGPSWTFIIPAVTVGNIGQLAVDLLLNNLPSAEHIGRLTCPHALPFAGPSPPIPAHLSPILTPVELYSIAQGPGSTSTMIVAQQRSPVARGRAAEHALDLVDWATKEGAAAIILLGSANSAGRRDAEIRGVGLGGRVRFAATSAACLGGEEEKGRGEGAWLGEAVRKCGWGEIDGGASGTGRGWTAGEEGLTAGSEELLSGKSRTAGFLPSARKGAFVRECLEVCEEKSVPLVSLLMFVHEGDNAGDACVLASAVSWMLGIEMEGGELAGAEETSCGVGGVRVSPDDDAGGGPLLGYLKKWKTPPVWQQTSEAPIGLY